MVRRVLTGFAIAFVLSLALPAAAQPVGTFAVQGQLGADRHQGTVTIERTGDTFSVIWQIQGATFRGVGIFADGVLSVAYSGGSTVGLALYRQGQGGAWEGRWAPVAGRQIGTETWTPAGRGAAQQPPAQQPPAQQAPAQPPPAQQPPAQQPAAK